MRGRAFQDDDGIAWVSEWSTFNSVSWPIRMLLNSPERRYLIADDT